MEAPVNHMIDTKTRTLYALWGTLVLIGLGTFALGLSGDHPEQAWRTYMINFLFWSAVAQGGLLFSPLMHLTKARWTGPLATLSESFVAFFPVSFVLYLALLAGNEYLFPWLQHETAIQDPWLNVPFLFARDGAALVVLYWIGMRYCRSSLQLRILTLALKNTACPRLLRLVGHGDQDLERTRHRTTILSIAYIIAFACVLSLLGFDLVMAMEPHWVSTLFGAYCFVKAFYVGLGCLIILASIMCLCQGEASGLTASHFHDLGKLFFAFCLVWADFFYCQLLVIWYGNVSEETSYLAQRVAIPPWNRLAWAVFIICFVVPFLALLNKKIKTKPLVMSLLCLAVLKGIWFEHLLLLGPAWYKGAASLPVGLGDGLISLGFFGLLALALNVFLRVTSDILCAQGEGRRT
jgi:hypothetical protein